MACAPENTAAIILAAGSSGRMGIPKSLLKLPDGTTFLENSVAAFLECGIPEVVIVVHPTVHKVLEYKKPWYFPHVKFVVNTQQEKGRIFSIRLGLESISDHFFAFIHNVDQPFLTSELIEHMMRKAETGTYVVPSFEGTGGHPVLMDPVIIDTALNNSKEYPDLHSLLEQFYKNTVISRSSLVCENINTPDDYQRVFGKKPE